jgi:hypothetical protein
VTQAEEALAYGNAIRRGMKARRDEIAALPINEGLRAVADCLERPDDIVGRMKVGYLLRSVDRVGRTKAIGYVRAVGLTADALERRVKTQISHNARLRPDESHRPLSLRARAALIDHLLAHAVRYEQLEKKCVA